MDIFEEVVNEGEEIKPIVKSDGITSKAEQKLFNLASGPHGESTVPLPGCGANFGFDMGTYLQLMGGTTIFYI